MVGEHKPIRELNNTMVKQPIIGELEHIMEHHRGQSL